MPDAAAANDAAPIVAKFEALDRAALHGAFLHRDLIWFAFLASVLAVTFAVAGEIHFPPFREGHGWAFIELITLLAIAVIIYMVRRGKLQDRWTACRLAAEQTRIARMCLPLLVVPPALRGTDKPPKCEDSLTVQLNSEVDLAFHSLAEVKRAVRDQGLPRLPGDFSSSKAAEWLEFIVADQLTYHQRNHRKLEHAEKRLRSVTHLVFVLSIVAVILHFSTLEEWLSDRTGVSGLLLFFTAAGPALAAALHGAGTRLGIVHRIALSEETGQELKLIRGKLLRFAETNPLPDSGWPQLRKLALDAANAMGSENTAWHQLVRREPDDLT